MKLGLIILFVGLSACTANYSRTLATKSLSEIGLSDELSYSRNADWLISASSKIAVVGLAEREFDGYPRATFNFNQVLRRSFDEHFHYTRFVLPNANMEENVDLVSRSLSKYGPLDYHIVANLNEIDDSLNSQSELYEGKTLHEERPYGRDLVRFQLRVFDARTGKLLDQIQIVGKAAFFSETNDSAVDLFTDSLDYALRALTGK